MKQLKILALAVILCSCGASQPATTQVEPSSEPSQSSNLPANPFTKWNDCASLTKLKEFVEASTAVGNKGFIPKKDRLAVFDMDGTLYGELYPTYLEYVMYQYRVLEDPAYKNQATEDQILLANEIRTGIMKDKEGKDVPTAGNSFPSGTDIRHATLAAQVYAGMTLKQFDEYCVTFFKKEVPLFNNMTYGDAFYQPMKEVVSYLQENDYNVYIVSGSDRFICRNLCCDYLDIPSDHVIGMDVRLKATGQGDEDGVNYTFLPTDQVLRSDELIIKNLKFNKVQQICQEIGQQPVLSFGNSGGDQAMHTFTLTDNKYPSAAFMLVADDAERDYAVLEKTKDLPQKWSGLGFNVVSMKNDFKTIYGENVIKKPII